MRRSAVECPRDLPARQPRALRGGPPIERLAVRLALVTPVLGGAAQLRRIDEIDPVRVPSIRGQLRFWWRALHAQEFSSPRELWEKESALFGRAADEHGGRSPVEVRVQIEKQGPIDESDLAGENLKLYALFPARKDKERPKAAQRLSPTTWFRLELRGPAEELAALQHAVRAWILFGGYGSRTRRGLGSLAVHADDPTLWLPSEVSTKEFARLFGRNIFEKVGQPSETPRLAGASLVAGSPVANAEQAWMTALAWLFDFRQGTQGEPKQRAREPGDRKRPSISNWPEADKIRHLTGKTRSHPPRHTDDPAWPRAGFGLPIVGRFQTRGRSCEHFDEPDPFEILWKHGNELRNRLASPLIVKAMQLASGQFVPIALWLERAFPAEGMVVLRTGGAVKTGSAAPFDRLLGSGDKARFPALAGKTSLRAAFLDWLSAKPTITTIAG